MHSPVLTGPESGSVAHGSVLIRVPGQTACRSRPLHCPSALARITFISRIAKLFKSPPFSSLSVSATRSSPTAWQAAADCQSAHLRGCQPPPEGHHPPQGGKPAPVCQPPHGGVPTPPHDAILPHRGATFSPGRRLLV